ncbi:MAG: hypothetical protein GY821_05100, partial [Gammaproteobacteria bacterium]|nr:hypothetical protein [Gammaproteobacteria bacterium]
MATDNNNNEGIENNIIDQEVADQAVKTGGNAQQSGQDPDGKIDAEGMLITGKEEENIEDYQDDLSLPDEESEEQDLFSALAVHEIDLNSHHLPDSFHYGFDSDQILTTDDLPGRSTEEPRVQQLSNEAPTIITEMATAAENQTAVLPNITASDPDGDPITFSLNLSLGDDSNAFTIDKDTGALTFKISPDFETPTDVGDGNGVYDVTVIATDSFGNASEKTIGVTVTDVNEAPDITTTVATAAENQKIVLPNVAATDPEGNPITFTLNLALGDDSN